jgi:ketosteroid isomerase-like protein
MMPMKLKHWPVALCLLLAAAVSLAQGPADDRRAVETKLTALENIWNQAQVHRDTKALEALIAENFTNTEWDGEVSNRAQFLADIKNPQYKPTLVTTQEVKVDVFGTTAILTGTYHTKGSFEGKPYDHYGRFTDTWTFQDNRWQCVASHTSLLKKNGQ